MANKAEILVNWSVETDALGNRNAGRSRASRPGDSAKQTRFPGLVIGRRRTCCAKQSQFPGRQDGC